MSGAKPERNDALFNDVHSFLNNTMVDLSKLRETLEANEDMRQSEIDILRKELEHERFENREQINKFRYEFDELVHRRVEKVIESIEEMQRSQKKDDTVQQVQLDSIAKELMKLKINLSNVSAQWGRLKEHSSNRQPLSY
eukprot:gnl/MRDRNA2_/MRDRNA2_89259_c0_seq1.p1 gnl/MRDRNA2_/MRDRNA2_89259_c0~~gnl/MRDRNA2_/MRDRNA2_89259_c0_seq1.p1  ORF type:complete len:140 (+),score=38.31 gnl/MRDRNA2_/MRDRNA2_89259_c0_seq1:85-504(+)